MPSDSLHRTSTDALIKASFIVCMHDLDYFIAHAHTGLLADINPNPRSSLLSCAHDAYHSAYSFCVLQTSRQDSIIRSPVLVLSI